MKQEHDFHIELPRALWEQFKKLAAKNRRKLKEEALIAIENHIKAKRNEAGAKAAQGEGVRRWT